jgi:pSer/pThr/pTyr-binding forkhead associated (FHA) protein/tetratricopeptide (TPR) repeat protein
MKLIIEDDEGKRTIVPFLGDALNIGRADENQVRLGEKNVSRKHGRILRASWGFVVEDFSTFAGIRVNGEKVKGKRQIKEGDLIQISEFDLQLEAGPDDLPKTEQQAQIDGAHAALSAERDDDEVTQVPTSAEKEARRHEETAVIKLTDLQPALAISETIDIDPAEQPRLVAASGPLREQEFPLRRSPASIGRALENDVCLDNPQVSRSHCRLALVGGGWKVIDAESRHGVKVNGEPYAASPLHHGDLLEVGPVRLVFALPGKAVSLPEEPASTVITEAHGSAAPIHAPISEPEPIASGSGASKLSWGVGAVLVVIAVGVLVFGHRKPSSREPDPADASLQRAGTMAAAPRDREAVRALHAAIDAGAPAEKTRVLPSLETEARAEAQFEQLVDAISRQDFDAARSLLDQLATVPTWYGGRSLEKSAEIKAGYVKTHVDRANAEKGRDDAACLTEANLALAANPQSDAARALATDCGGATASNAAHARAPERTDSMSPATPLSATPRPSAAQRKTARVSTEDNDAEARRLLHQGNVEATANDLTSAIADLERAIRLKPSQPILGSIYRSLGTTNSRAGHADKGAYYYRLYLPYCDNPAEKAQLSKMLADYDKSHG